MKHILTLYPSTEHIRKEILEYKEDFFGKKVYCNNDDPETSPIFAVLKDLIDKIDIQRLTSTYEVPFGLRKYCRPIRTELFSSYGTPRQWELDDYGFFSSPPCIRILEQSDIVVSVLPDTWQELYFHNIIMSRKGFLILADRRNMVRPELLKAFKEGKVWFGHNKPTLLSDGKDGKTKRTYNMAWFTNLGTPHYSKPRDWNTHKYSPEEYKTYENYHAIEVSSPNLLPYDYDGVMGVPLSFLELYNPEQFEIIGADDSTGTYASNGLRVDGRLYPERPIVDGSKVGCRLFIKWRNPKTTS